MADAKYYVLPGEASKVAKMHDLPVGNEIVQLDNSLISGCMFNQAAWFRDEMRGDGSLVKHASDELMMFMGSDVNNHEDLGMEIVYQLENDILVLDHTCFLFIPAGVAHGLLEVRNVRRPCLCTTCFYDESDYEESPATATEPKGKYANHVVEKYAPVQHREIPPAPEGFLTMLLWIDGEKLAGAPYMESVWFKCVNMSGPPCHTHEFGEVIGFLGADPDNPDDLGGEIQIVIDEKTISSTKSFYTYIPAGVSHSPILVPKLDRPLIHFSGGGKGNYIRNDL